MKAIAVLASALLFCTAALAKESPRDELVRTDEAWSAAAAEGKDVEKVVAYWSDDATIVPAGAPMISGKAAIRDYVTQSFATPGFSIRWKTLDAAVSDDGTMGYTTAESTMTFPGPDGKLMTETGRGITVWRRDASGAWKCVYDTWNSGPRG
jgi:ketosteroid isomerase-like protein